MNDVANTGHFNEQLKEIEIMERITLQEQIEMINRISNQLNSLRKEKSNIIDSFASNKKEKLESINYEISKLWESLKELEKDRAKENTYYKKEKQRLIDIQNASTKELPNKTEESVDADKAIPKRYRKRFNGAK